MGEKYLLDLDYEQAIVQFLGAIEIEPKNTRAYIGAAEAYIALGHTDDAIAILQQGLDATGDAAIAEMLAELTAVPEPTPAPIPKNIAEIIGGIKTALCAEDVQKAYTLANSAELTEFMTLQEYEESHRSFDDGNGFYVNSYDNGNAVRYIDAEKNSDGKWTDGVYYRLSNIISFDPFSSGSVVRPGYVSCGIAGGKFTGAYENMVYDMDWDLTLISTGTVANGVFSGVQTVYYDSGSFAVTYIDDGYAEYDTEHTYRLMTDRVGWVSPFSEGVEGPND
ncbi:hypothetical protein FACS18949_10360 [Clostridia bacterium]|nr:hypothetical protein FACS18949_10360 [Clostridia bacterium]